MNDVKKRMYYNRFCSICKFRDPDILTNQVLDDCVNSKVLDLYVNNAYDDLIREDLRRGAKRIVGLHCLKAIPYCNAYYFIYKRRLVPLNDKRTDCRASL